MFKYNIKHVKSNEYDEETRDLQKQIKNVEISLKEEMKALEKAREREAKAKADGLTGSSAARAIKWLTVIFQNHNHISVLC